MSEIALVLAVFDLALWIALVVLAVLTWRRVRPLLHPLFAMFAPPATLVEADVINLEREHERGEL